MRSVIMESFLKWPLHYREQSLCARGLRYFIHFIQNYLCWGGAVINVVSSRLNYRR